jgi:hypothetical protein
MAHACYVCSFYPVPDGEGVACPHCHRSQYGTTCPHCSQNAPPIVRKLSVYCSACNQLRGPLTSGMPLNVVGRPSQVGSTITKVAGVGALAAGLCVAAVLATLGLAIGSGVGTFFLVLAALVALGGGGLGALMLFGSKKLRESGEQAQRSARESAIYALAGNRGGVLTAVEVASALNIQLAEADALLTQMAREGSRVGLEVDAQGVVHYLFREAPRPFSAATHAAGVGAAGPSGVRVEPELSEAPTEARGASEGSERERVREQVDREFERLQRMSPPKR